MIHDAHPELRTLVHRYILFWQNHWIVLNLKKLMSLVRIGQILGMEYQDKSF